MNLNFNFEFRFLFATKTNFVFLSLFQELDILSLPENNEGQLTERNKRTIGVLRQLFPELSKVRNNFLDS